MLHCRFVILLKMIVDIKVDIFMLEFVDIKVAHRFDSFKVGKFCWKLLISKVALRVDSVKVES